MGVPERQSIRDCRSRMVPDSTLSLNGYVTRQSVLPEPARGGGVAGGDDILNVRPPVERVEVITYPERWYHVHGRVLNGVRHAHPLRPNEEPDEPEHLHEGRGGMGAALYPVEL